MHPVPDPAVSHQTPLDALREHIEACDASVCAACGSPRNPEHRTEITLSSGAVARLCWSCCEAARADRASFARWWMSLLTLGDAA